MPLTTNEINFIDNIYSAIYDGLIGVNAITYLNKEEDSAKYQIIHNFSVNELVNTSNINELIKIPYKYIIIISKHIFQYDLYCEVYKRDNPSIPTFNKYHSFKLIGIKETAEYYQLEKIYDLIEKLINNENEKRKNSCISTFISYRNFI